MTALNSDLIVFTYWVHGLLITDALKTSIDVTSDNLPFLVRSEIVYRTTERSALNFLWLFADIISGFSDVLIAFVIITMGQFRSVR